MVDIHSHCLFGADDGALFLEESLRMLEEAEKIGVKAIIATPHFHGTILHMERVAEHFAQLKSRLPMDGVQLHLGYEVQLSQSLPRMLEERQGMTLNNSRYLLCHIATVELPLYTNEVLDQILATGIIPIIAHPERSRVFMKGMKVLSALVKRGCLMQVDAASIIGVNGFQAKRLAKHLLDRDEAHFISSDAHRVSHYTEWYYKAYLQVEKWIGIDKACKLFCSNPQMVLEDRHLDT